MFGGAAVKHKSDTHASRFEKHRAAEKKLEHLKGAVRENEKVILYATWENNSGGVIANRRHKEQVERMHSQEGERLMERRRQLAQLYNTEMEQWEKEVLSNVETIEQRKLRIRARAIALRDERESDRAKFVEKCYERQWRDACDDARLLDSLATTSWVTSQRQEQIANKQLNAKMSKEEEAKYLEKIHERMRFLEEKEKESIEKREQLNQAMKGDLDAQVRYNFERRMNSRLQQMREDKEELGQLRELLEADELKKALAREERRRDGDNVLKFNEGRLNLRKEQAERERKEDLLLIHYAMKKDELGQAEEKAKKDKEKQEMHAYNEYLKQQMIKELSDQSEYDKVRLAAENRIWEEKDRQQQAQADARRSLMKAVHEGRQEQITLRHQREAEAKMYADEQLNFDRSDFELQEREDRKREVERKKALIEEAAHLRKQVEERREALEREQQELYLQQKQMELFERQHTEKLAQQAGHVKKVHPRNQTKWYT